ncbi:hypothetical protein [Parasulfitobacter algicola]|uniref:Uncharacterized protein n=1 Tax=Parasulfitobacter algicola TaxID=2614809 RepID=A0ABX2IYQ0_9RHOB|nr:hypothetical protein [Sulfitobacter algicola]NSX55764.1 hypothetical protein [Sulfitobacter algicola]
MTTASTPMPISSCIWVGTLILVVVIEIILMFGLNTQGYPSNILRGWAVVGLAAPFGWGTLAGHFFHPVDVENWRGILAGLFDANSIAPTAIAAGLIVILAIIDLIVALAFDHHIYPDFVSPIMLGLGFIWGALCWPA